MIAADRIKALSWVGTHNKGGLDPESEILANFRSQLDAVVLSGDDAKLVIGWGLTPSKTPFALEWSNGIFSDEEIPIAEAEAQNVEKDEVIFELNP